MSDREFETWAGRFLISSASADDRQAQLAIAAETIERDMVIWFGHRLRKYDKFRRMHTQIYINDFLSCIPFLE